VRLTNSSLSNKKNNRIQGLKKLSTLVAAAWLAGALLVSPGSMAQTTTVTSESPTTTQAAATTATATSLVDAAAPESTLAPVEVVDNPVPTGGVDAGLGGTAENDETGTRPVLALGAIVVGSVIARRLAKSRKAL
jgi:hypothetical protein